ncbi:MAG: IclR family transcriptional regulator C-terminal domain-containing protein [Dehalococcoidales bacterium]
MSGQKTGPAKIQPATGSIAHAAAILVCLSKDIHNVSDIARECNFSKSTVHRVLKLLEQSQLVVQDTINRQYYLSLLVSRFAVNAISTHKRLILYSDAEMRRLSSASGETVSLDILSGMQLLSLHDIPSQHDLRVTRESYRLEQFSAGLFSGASVKVLMAQLDASRLNMLLDIIKITTPNGPAVTDRNLLLAQLRDILVKGYAVSRGERIQGTLCIAAPISNYILPVGLSVVGPEPRMQPRVKEIIIELKASAARITRNIEGKFGQRG